MQAVVGRKAEPDPQPPLQIEAVPSHGPGQSVDVSGSSDGVDFPEDILINILYRLPVKSLIRFTCVCKLWLSLIKSREFVDRYHIARSNLLGDAFDYCLFYDCQSSDFTRTTFSFYSYDSLQLDLSTYPIFECKPIPPRCGSLRCEIAGPCNGVFCLSFSIGWPPLRFILLWNPSMRDTRVLSGVQSDLQSFGFGFDPRTGDYKVIYTHARSQANHNIHLVELYSLSSDSWRTLDASYFLNIDKILALETNEFECGLQTSSNGRMFNWMVYYSYPLEHFITFDMSDEVFMETPLPGNGVDNMLYTYGFINCPSNKSQACVCRFHEKPHEDSTTVEFWVLDSEYGPTASWTKFKSLILSNTMLHYANVVGLWKDDLLLWRQGPRLRSYDFVSNRIREVESSHDFFGITYTESLVSVKRGSHELDRQEEEQRLDHSCDMPQRSQRLSFGKVDDEENAFVFEIA